MRKIIRFFSLLIFSSFIMVLLSTNNVSANFDKSKNYVKISSGTENGSIKIGVSITYQRGIEKSTAIYKMCLANNNDVLTPEGCTDWANVLGADSNGWAPVISSGNDSDYISKQLAKKADNNPTTKFFAINTGVQVDSTDRENYYVVFVQTFFCAVRETSDTGYNSCQYWHDGTSDAFTRHKFKVGEALNNDVEQIQDDELQEMMRTITEIVEETILPIIYVVLGAFLVIKGTITGIQIVKSSDEPQVRQEKVHSLKWLVIGVAIAYAASGIVHLITAILKDSLGFN